jgi:hypothetical protein
MEEKRIEKLLNRLAKRMTEPVRASLGAEVKERIPGQLPHFRKGLDTINIIIDLRVSKLAAAAAIVLAMVLFANFISMRSPGGGLVEDVQLVAKGLFEDVDQTYLTAGRLKYGRLLREGKEAEFYGEAADPTDGNSVLVHWKLDNGNYGVMFVNLRERQVSPGELIRLQAQMLRSKGR